MIVVDPLTSSIFSQLSILISKKKFAEVIQMIKKVTKLLVIPATLFVSLSILLREKVIIFAYGIEYIEASDPFVVLVINAIVSAVLFWNRPLLESINLVKFRFYLNAISLVIGAVVAYITIPIVGSIGVAFGLLIANGLASIVSSLVAYNKTKNAIHEFTK